MWSNSGRSDPCVTLSSLMRGGAHASWYFTSWWAMGMQSRQEKHAVTRVTYILAKTGAWQRANLIHLNTLLCFSISRSRVEREWFMFAFIEENLSFIIMSVSVREACFERLPPPPPSFSQESDWYGLERKGRKRLF